MITTLLHGAVGYWDEIGTVIAIVSFVVLMSFLAWSSGNKRRKDQRERRLRRRRQQSENMNRAE
jgi:uncharacterized membrane protein